MPKCKDMFILFDASCLCVFPESWTGFVQRYCFSQTQSSYCCWHYGQRNGKHGFEISQKMEKLFQSTIFYTTNPNSKYQNGLKRTIQSKEFLNTFCLGNVYWNKQPQLSLLLCTPWALSNLFPDLLPNCVAQVLWQQCGGVCRSTTLQLNHPNSTWLHAG